MSEIGITAQGYLGGEPRKHYQGSSRRKGWQKVFYEASYYWGHLEGHRPGNSASQWNTHSGYPTQGKTELVCLADSFHQSVAGGLWEVSCPSTSNLHLERTDSEPESAPRRWLQKWGPRAGKGCLPGCEWMPALSATLSAANVHGYYAPACTSSSLTLHLCTGVSSSNLRGRVVDGDYRKGLKNTASADQGEERTPNWK